MYTFGLYLTIVKFYITIIIKISSPTAAAERFPEAARKISQQQTIFLPQIPTSRRKFSGAV
jgi:hypothetical protein